MSEKILTIFLVLSLTIMNALLADKIITVGQQVHPDQYVHAATVSYIQTLLVPYGEAIDPAAIEGVMQWIPLAFPGELAKHAMSEMIKIRLRIATELGKPDTDPEVEIEAKTAVIEYIVAELLELAGNVSRDRSADIILPWDVQKAVSSDEELSRMFGINEANKTLPVTVTVSQRQFTHMLNLEFTTGILLFSLATKSHFNITLFGSPLATDLVTDEEDYNNGFVCDEDINTDYSVEVAGTRYCFNAPDFMQGFATGALWTNVDHHLYWKNLVSYKINLETQERVGTPITF